VRALSEWVSKERLGPELPRPREHLTASVTEALAFQREVGGPVVAKASGVAHKSDQGLVRGSLDADTLRACWEALAAAGDGHVLVAEQRATDLELLVGGLRDSQFGPLVSVGMGGVRAEVDPDVAFLLAPVEPGELERALRSLRASPLLFGFRGRPPVDLDALGRVVDAVARLLTDDPSVIEIDCNPVSIDDGQPYVLDALVVVTDDSDATADPTTDRTRSTTP
jgi:acetyl-CoA synthetase (ADP-forming)